MAISEELQRLSALYASGELTGDEFVAAKTSLLQGDGSSGPRANGVPHAPAEMGSSLGTLTAPSAAPVAPARPELWTEVGRWARETNWKEAARLVGMCVGIGATATFLLALLGVALLGGTSA